jgi:hypothetical protein
VGREDGEHFAAQHFPERIRVVDLGGGDARNQIGGRLDADVGRDQQLLDLLQGRGVDLLPAGQNPAEAFRKALAGFGQALPQCRSSPAVRNLFYA